jgi:sodium/potassium-transporting ATPase subunit alpha
LVTGESRPVAASVTAQHANPIEARNLVFSSSLVMTGSAVGVVIRTGDDTFLG